MAYLDQIYNALGSFSPNLFGALAILIVGWIVALILSSIIGKALHRTGLDEKTARMVVGEEKAKTIESQRWISRIIYYVLLFFVLVAFFQALGLTLVAQPLNQLLTVVFSFLPKLFAALVIALVAWIVAVVLKKIILQVLQAAKVDEGVSSRTGLEGREIPLSQSIAEIVYYLVLLLFLPMVLSALGLSGLLEPLQMMISKILLFLPNLFAAALIVIIGWFLARILQKIVTNLLVALGAEKLSERIGLSNVLGEQGLSGLIGLIVYILILIPVLIAALQALALDAITQPVSNVLNQILGILPALFGAALVLAIGYLLGKVVAELIANLLAAMGFNSILARLGLGKEPASGERTPSQIVGYMVLVAIMLFALIEASQILGFTLLADLIYEFTIFAGHVLMGLIILAIGIYLANLAFNVVMSSGMSQARCWPRRQELRSWHFPVQWH